MTVICDVCGGNRGEEPVQRAYLRFGVFLTSAVIADADLCGPCRAEAEKAIATAAEKILSAPRAEVKVVTGEPGLPGTNQMLGLTPKPGN